MKCLRALLCLRKNNSTSLVIIVKSIEFYPSMDRSKIYPLLLGTSKEYKNIITASSIRHRNNFRDRLTFLKGQLLQYVNCLAHRLIHQLKLLVEHHQIQPLPTSNQRTNKATTIYNSQLQDIYPTDF